MPKMLSVAALAVALAVPVAAVAANTPPYQPLADMLGVPALIGSIGPKDKTQLQLKFAKEGQTEADWTKLLTIDIAEVPADETADSTYSIIETYKAGLSTRHVHVDTFDTSPLRPYATYFEFHVGTERDRGVIYSPRAGFVTIAQLAEKTDDTISSADVKRLKELAGLK